VQAPSRPGSFSGSNSGGRLFLKWKAATDNSGLVTAYRVYTNGKLAKTLGGSARSVDMGTYTTKDARSFQVAARDVAGNLSAKSSPLVIIPAIKKLTLSNAKSRLTGRGLKAGTISYAYSSSIPSGRVIGAGLSGVVRKGTAVSLKVSRGALSRASSYAFPAGSGPDGTTSPTYTFGGSPTSGSPVVGSQTGSDPAAGAPAPTGSETAAVGEVQPQSYTPADDDTTSPLRRLLGLALLGGAFLAAGGVALRARRPRLPRPVQGGGMNEPLLFWDERLLHTLTASVRHFTGRVW
jgi:hypothetical protein